MRLIRSIGEFLTPGPVDASQWTALIPAAGRGSRLNSASPKILYPILDKPILNWLTDLVKPLCWNLIVVASPDGASPIGEVLKPLWPKAAVLIQQTPTGMADAIAICEGFIKTPYTAVIWGDQITPRPRTLAACMSLLESSSSIQAVIPTMERDSPYIHFERDSEERIVEVFQARESDRQIARGESDCGLFFFRTPALFEILRQTRGDASHQGAKTKENNFLSILPLFHNAQGELVSVRLDDNTETLGINTLDDAENVSRILKSREDDRDR